MTSTAESPPSKIDDLLLELEDETQANAVIKNTILPLEVGWLIRAIQEKCTKDREKMSEEIERELNVSPHDFLLSRSKINI